MALRMIGELQSSPVVQRYPGNPVLSAEEVPYPATLVVNAGVTKVQGRYVMVFRNDYGEHGNVVLQGTNLGIAFSEDGVDWEVTPEPFLTLDQARRAAAEFYANRDEGVIFRAYDPRLTVIDGRCIICFALDTQHGVRGGTAVPVLAAGSVTQDFASFEIVSLTVPDDRNMVVLPERVHGQYVRLERPFPVYGRWESEAFDIWASESPDLRYWANADLVLGVEDVPFANNKIGPGAPPIKTERGWLALCAPYP